MGTNRNQLIRAALESMAYQSRDVLNAMERDSGLSIPMLKVDGGGAMNNFLLQFQSDLIQVPVERYKVNELTALGAAFLAGLAIDFWKKEDLSIEMDKRFDPQRSAQEMDQRYQNWQNAVKACQAFKSDTL